ncbi:MAG: hypothetical protein BWX72_00439 [Firmicutes bacterium ADurb.Bin080]|jgi:hypothetical protein|nr:MAG: hypothetical protein BWX72_00439 [Firmicutes bacterium ADurb.Bin080]
MSNKRTNDWDSTPRKPKNIPIAVNNLVFCCGEKTEKHYFDRVCEIIKSNFPKITGINFDILVCAKDPLTMAQEAEEIVKNSYKIGRTYQHTWVVFDKDDFEKDNFDNTIKKLKDLNKRKEFKGTTVFHPLWSNQCIEFWFLIHFCLLETDITREEYIKKLSEKLKEKYQKNDENILKKILEKGGKIRKAIENAKRIRDNHQGKTPSESKPATAVYEFFEHHKDYINLG